MSERHKILLSFAIVYTVWGSTYLAIRIGVQYLPSALFAGVRFVAAGAVMLLGLKALGRPLRASRADLASLAAAGFLLLATGNGLVMLAEKTVPSGLAALIIATVPLWIAGLSAILPNGEQLAPRGVVGIILGLLGLAVLSWPQLSLEAGSGTAVPGILILLLASLSWSAGTLIVRRRPVRLSPLAATGWEMLFGGIFSLIGGALFQGGEPIIWNGRLLGALAYLTVLGSLVAFSAYIWLVQHVPAAKVATYAYVNPLIAVFLGWWLLRETVDLAVLGGMTIILVGVVLVNSSRINTGSGIQARQRPPVFLRLLKGAAD